MRNAPENPATHATNIARRRRQRRIGLWALGLAIAFSASTYSSSGDDDPLRTAVRPAADRLLSLQRADGLWGRDATGPGDISVSGRPARALLAAHALLGDFRYRDAADRTAEALLEHVGKSRLALTSGNLTFLAEYGRISGRSDVTERAASLRHGMLLESGELDGAQAARHLMARENGTPWLDGAWRNYLLWHAGEQAELARAVGDTAWERDYVLTIASSWLPKDDFQYWVLGAGRMLRELSRIPGERARRLAAVELAAIQRNELRPGIPWCDTPYDSTAYTLEASAALQGLLSSHDAAARQRALDGLRGLALRQAPEGGWAGVVSLHERGAGAVTTDETPELDAEMLLAYALALRSAPLAPDV